MTILMVTKFVPNPPDSGGKLRSLAVLRRLAAIDRVVLCAFEDRGADVAGLERDGISVRTMAPPSGPAAMGRGLLATGAIGAARFWHPRMARLIRDVIDREDPRLVVVEYAQLAPYAGRAAGRYRILDLHNIESALIASYAAAAGPARAAAARLEAAALRRMERRAYGDFDSIAVVSHADGRLLPTGLRDVVVCPNGWEPQAPLPAASGPVAVFIGLLGWKPNEDAALHLGREIWPRVRAAVPDARLLLVGRDPTDAVVGLGRQPGIEVVGAVPDVRPWLAQARVALAPLRAGGGSRSEILEALEAGRPVVATTVGAGGLEDLAGRGLVVADDDGHLAEEAGRLLTDREGAEALGRLGREAVHARYSWDLTLAPLIERASAAVLRAS